MELWPEQTLAVSDVSSTLLEFGSSNDGHFVLLKLIQELLTADKSSKNFFLCSGMRFPPEKFCNGDPPVHESDMCTWQNKCTSPTSRSETDLVIVSSCITCFTRSATWFWVLTCLLKVSMNTNVTSAALSTRSWQDTGFVAGYNKRPPPFHTWNGSHRFVKNLKLQTKDWYLGASAAKAGRIMWQFVHTRPSIKQINMLGSTGSQVEVHRIWKGGDAWAYSCVESLLLKQNPTLISCV